jgi:photosystem II stability/assembly factor-like uncharacterized protein
MKRTVLTIFLLGAAALSFAQNPTKEDQFSRRAALIPKEPEDTGKKFSDAAMRRERAMMFAALRTSGEVTDIREVHEITNREFRKLRTPIAYKQQPLPAWKPIAGDQEGAVSGRSRNMCFVGSNIAYVAYAQGGIWKTENINENPPKWVCLTDNLPSIAFGSIANHPSQPDVLYAGTGEAEGDNYMEPPGDGLFKTTDGGLNWFKILSRDTLGPFCSQIAIDPKDANKIYIATGTNKSGNAGGLLRSTDAGKTWLVSSITGFAPLDVEIDPDETNRIYISGIGRVYRSEDFGATWTQLKTGLPTSTVGRIELAISPSNTSYVYASVGINILNRKDPTTYGLYYSTDRGDTWQTKSEKPSANWLGTQADFANAILVHPTNNQFVVLGGLDIHTTANLGGAFTQKSDWTDDPGTSRFSHADVHGLYFQEGTSKLYANTDGGISLSRNLGNTWNTSINAGIATLQFVGVDADKNFNFVLGGTQDNGTNKAYIDQKSFSFVRGGDGGHTFIAPNDSSICYTTYVEGDMYKSTQSGNRNTWTKLNPVFNGSAPFYNVYDFDADGKFGAAWASVTGNTNKIWVTTDGGLDKFNNPSSTGIAGINNYGVPVIHVFKNNAKYMWAGSGSGAVWRSEDYGLTFTRTSITGAGAITGIISHPNDPKLIWVCSQGVNSGTSTSNAHVYKSTDGGETFTAIPNFPNIGCWSIERKHEWGMIFVATDKGIVYTEDEGANWYALEEGIPAVQVLTLKLRGANNDKLLAGTYGRGMFWLDVNKLSVRQPVTAPEGTVTIASISPNPLSVQGTVSLEIASPTLVTLTLYDAAGRPVRIIEKTYMDAGKRDISFSAADLARGTYFVTVTADGISRSQRIVIE